jgi:preprotein translocase subunit SecG
MYTVLVILILVVSVLLGLVVLVQNSKGGGLISNFGSANQMMGVRQTTDFLEKATWTMAIILVVLCLMSSMSIKTSTSGGVQESQMREQIELNTPIAPAAEAPAAEMPAE